MLTEERRKEILSYIKSNNSATVSELSSLYFVSDATIRRDLSALDDAGSIKRTYGGAVLIDSGAKDRPLLLRKQENKEAKETIAQLAIEFIRDGDTLFVDSGTTTLAFARKLGGFDQLTVVTNSLSVCAELAKFPSIKLYCSGGRLRENTSSFIGGEACAYIENFLVDYAILSARGLHQTFGITESSDAECQIKKTALHIGKKVILLCDSSKLGQAYFSRTCNIDKLDYLITEKPVYPELAEALNHNNCEIIMPKHIQR